MISKIVDTYTTFQFLTYNKNSLANIENLHVVACHLGGALDFTPPIPQTALLYVTLPSEPDYLQCQTSRIANGRSYLQYIR
jgi:hypothetical protein